MQIELVKNEGFKWYHIENISAKGYLYDKEKVYQREQVCEFFSKIDFSSDKLSEFLQDLNGCFSVVIKQADKIYLVSDRLASFPLYVSLNTMEISDSVDYLLKEKNYELNQIAIEEMLYSSYIVGNKTAIQGIEVVDLGQYFEIEDSQIKKTYYYRHLHQETIKENLKLKYQEKNDIIFENLINSLDGRTAVIPLSGGYDSRYIAAMLKKKNYTNVICYTYGNEASYEVQNSKKVAQTLGYPWYFVPYSKKIWRRLIDNELVQYCDFAHNYYCAPNVQDFVAVKYLVNNKIIDKNCVIVNGFCGDLPAGSFVLDEKIENTKQDLIEYIYSQNYKHLKQKEKIKKKIMQEIDNHISQISNNVKDYKTVNYLNEEWFTAARPCKWVINSNRTYEYFGMEWRMPLWDKEFMDFFYQIKLEERKNCKFYQEFLFEELFNPMNINMKKPQPRKAANNLKQKIRRYIIIIINHFRVLLKNNLVNMNSINEYGNFSVLLSKQVKNKRMLNYHNINAHQMMAIWWAEKKYGENYIKKILKGKNKNEN